MMRNQRGITIVEMIVAVAIIAITVGVGVHFFAQSVPFFQRSQVRQKILWSSRHTMDTIVQLLHQGKAGTLRISTPQVVPNSRVDFVLETPLPSGTTSYAIYLDNAAVYILEYPDGTNPKRLADQVTSLMFTGDSRDPAIVNVSLQMDASYDSTGEADHITSVLLPNQVVHMAETHE